VVAVDVDHLEVQGGAITALIGPNGAGKTTTFNLVTGFERPDRGRWRFEDQDLRGKLAYEVPRTGLMRTFQLTKALARMPVIDNMKLAAADQRGERLRDSLIRPLWRAEERAAERHADELLERFNLANMRSEYAGTLSGGQRKLLEFARALMVEPRFLLLDEPMAGINLTLGARLLDHVRELRERDGVTFLFIEHDLDVVMRHSDRVIVMAQGDVIAAGRPDEVRRDRRVIDAYLGGAA
jgi:branched-chain amino acid transport system ATP-binding protein